MCIRDRLFGIALLKFGADYVVNNSVTIATALGISERVIGITVILSLIHI